MDDAVDLVLYAFQNGQPGDLFVQKAPAATIGTLAKAMMEVLELDRDIQVIGTRHGEKLFETLLTREERARAMDLEVTTECPRTLVISTTPSNSLRARLS